MATIFCRSVILARVLAPEDVAISSILTLLLTTFELVTNGGLNAFVISQDGPDDPVLGTVHAISIIRGVLVGSVIFIFSPHISNLFSVQDASSSFRLIAIVPILQAFLNQDIYRQQRKMLFFPLIATELAGAIAMISSLFVVAQFTRDHSAVAISTIFQYFVMVLVSCFFSRISYKARLCPVVLSKMRAFSMPLILNGFLLVLTVNGDRIVLALNNKLTNVRRLDLVDFASYTISYGFMYALVAAFMGLAVGVFVPLLVASRESEDVFDKRVTLIACGLSLSSLLFQTFFCCFGLVAIGFIYGEQYAVNQQIVAAIAIGLSFRVTRTTASCINLARQRTWRLFFETLSRSLAVPFSLLLLVFGFGIAGVVYTMVVFEVISTIVGFGFSFRRNEYYLNNFIRVLAPIFMLSIGNLLLDILPVERLDLKMRFAFSLLCMLLALLWNYNYIKEVFAILRRKVEVRALVS